MIPFLFRRFLQAIPTLLLSTILVFFIIQLAPGDFLTPMRLNPNTTPEQIQMMERNFGLDKPALTQYFYWMRNMLHGDFGQSFQYQQPVLDIAWPRIKNSMWLVLLNTLFFYMIAIPLGVFGAVRQNTFADKAINVVMYFLLGFPNFFLALIVIFGILRLNNATGWHIPMIGMTSENHSSLSQLGKILDVLKHIFIPALVLAIADSAGFSRSMRGLMLDQLNSDYIRTARSKGLSERVTIWKHTFRNAIVPVVAGIGGLLPGMISGAGLAEVVFAYPGITPMFLDALNSQDLYLMCGFIIISSVLLIIGNALSDILLAVVDPRISYR